MVWDALGKADSSARYYSKMLALIHLSAQCANEQLQSLEVYCTVTAPALFILLCLPALFLNASKFYCVRLLQTMEIAIALKVLLKSVYFVNHISKVI